MFALMLSLSLTHAGVQGAFGKPWNVTLCHCPVGNPDECVRITVGAPAADIHLTNHPDDFEGVCPPRLLWEREIDLRGEAYSLSTALAADDTRLVIRAYQPGYESPTTPMFGLRAKDGRTMWTSDEDDLGDLSEGLDQERVYSTSPAEYEQLWFPEMQCIEVQPGLLHGWDAMTGEKITEEVTTNGLALEVMQVPRSVLVAGFDDQRSGTDCDDIESRDYFAALQDSETGQLQWSHAASHGKASGAAANYDGSVVFFVGRTGDVYPWNNLALLTYAHDAETGEVKWSVPFEACDGQGSGSDVIVSHDDSTVYVKHRCQIGDDYHVIILAYDAESGEQLWQAIQPSTDIYDMVLSANGEVLITSGLVTVAYGTRDGSELWSTEYSPGTVFALRAATPTAVVLSGSQDGVPTTKGVRPETGAVVWSVTSERWIENLAVGRYGRRFYVAGSSPNGFSVEAYTVPGIIPATSNLGLAGGDL
jgi:outer membrane protein assembly factor BamB